MAGSRFDCYGGILAYFGPPRLPFQALKDPALDILLLAWIRYSWSSALMQITRAPLMSTRFAALLSTGNSHCQTKHIDDMVQHQPGNYDSEGLSKPQSGPRYSDMKLDGT